jgi:hypothetical protein
MTQEMLQRFQPTGRRANADDRKCKAGHHGPWLPANVIGAFFLSAPRWGFCFHNVIRVLQAMLAKAGSLAPELKVPCPAGCLALPDDYRDCARTAARTWPTLPPDTAYWLFHS